MAKNRLYSFASIGFSLILWELAAIKVNSKSFPHLKPVFSDLMNLIQTFDFWRSLTLTLWLALIGFLIGVVISLFIGIFISLNEKINLSLDSSINFLRAIPSVVFLPLLVASIGSSMKTSIILTSLVVSLKMIIYIVRGIEETEISIIEISKVFMLPLRSKLSAIYLPSVISIAGTGLRLSASRAFGTVIACGIVIGAPGLGQGLLMAESNAQYERVFSYVIILGLLGTSIYSLFNFLENRLFKWRVSI